VSIETGAVTHRLIAAGGGFTVSLVAREQRALVRKFVKPATWDAANVTLNDVPVAEAPVSGIPVLTGAQSGSPAAVDCRVVAQHDLGSHSLFVGEVVDVLGDVNEEFEILRMEDTKMSYGG
ncbi:MAG TPA: flavin reductase family protein, partial [Acidimicrobiales bacterium]|nr:flavin reductase family protein [Acidimicrobiales bacterium]